MMRWLCLLLVLLLARPAGAQPTLADLEAISPVPLGDWDFAGGTLRPQAGTTCTATDCDDAAEAGRLCVDTNATSGSQFYVCEGASGWILSSGGGGGSSNSFETWDASSGTNPVADSATDTMTLTCTAPMVCTGDSATDSVTIALGPTATPAPSVSPTPMLCATAGAAGGLYGAHPEVCKALTTFTPAPTTTATPVLCATAGGVGGLYGANPEVCQSLATYTPAPTITTTPYVCGAGEVLDRTHPEGCVTLPTPDGAGGLVASSTPTPAANQVFAGPTSGAVGSAIWRLLVGDDIPTEIARDIEIPTPVLTVTATPVLCATAGAAGGLYGANPEQCKSLATFTPAPTVTATPVLCATAGGVGGLYGANPEVCQSLATYTPAPTTTATPLACATDASGHLGGLYQANPELCKSLPATVTPWPTLTPFATVTPTPLACATAAGGLLGGLYQANPELCKAIPATPTPVPTKTPPWTNADLPVPLIIGPTYTATPTATSTAATPTPTSVTPTPTATATPNLIVGPNGVTRLEAYPSCALITTANGDIECDSLTSISRLGPTIEGTEVSSPFTWPAGTTNDGGTGANASTWLLPRHPTSDSPNCTNVTAEASMCWDTTADVYYVGDGSTAQGLARLKGDQTIVGINIIGPGPTSTPAATPTATAATPTATAATPTPTVTATPPIQFRGKVSIDGDLQLQGDAARTLQVESCSVPPCIGKGLTVAGGDGNGSFKNGGNLTLESGTGGGAVTVTPTINSLFPSLTGYVTLNGKVYTGLTTGETAPSVATCGTSPSVTGTKFAGRINVGTGGSASACTLTFNNSGYTNAPACVVSSDVAANGCLRAQTSTTTLIVTNYDCAASPATRAFAASAVINYICVGL